MITIVPTPLLISPRYMDNGASNGDVRFEKHGGENLDGWCAKLHLHILCGGRPSVVRHN